MSATQELVPGIRRWTCPHPEYRTRAEEVVSYALTVADAVALVDPLLPPKTTRGGRRCSPGSTSSAGAARRLEIWSRSPTTRAARRSSSSATGATSRPGSGATRPSRKRFAWDTPLTEIPRGKTGSVTAVADGLAEAYTIGNPRRLETPLYFPALQAMAFGDAVVGMPDGTCASGTRPTAARPGTATASCRPCEPLAELDVETVLVTHGPPVTRGGRRALRAALDAPPVTTYW